LTDLYIYILKITIVIALITSVAFFFIRDYGFALFSVPHAEISIFYIALAGIIIVPFNEITLISEKMLDGMGKSYISFILTIGLIIYEIAIVNFLAPIFTSGVCVLLGVLIGEITAGSIFLILLKYILKTHGKGKIPCI
jgi:hypothetical protein